MLKLFLTIYSGLEHAFEADHLLAVNSLVSKRKKTGLAILDGIFWGAGHTFTIAVVGIIMLGFRVNISPSVFHYFEAGVGLMLIVLGIYRIVEWKTEKKHLAEHHHNISFGMQNQITKIEPLEIKNFSLKDHHHINIPHTHSHKTAFGVGLIHGLAGSGALVLSVMAQSTDISEGLWFLLIFGIGSIMGMLLASALLSIPFSRRIMQSTKLNTGLIFLSSALCIVYGTKVIAENLF